MTRRPCCGMVSSWAAMSHSPDTAMEKCPEPPLYTVFRAFRLSAGISTGISVGILIADLDQGLHQCLITAGGEVGVDGL